MSKRLLRSWRMQHQPTIAGRLSNVARATHAALSEREPLAASSAGCPRVQWWRVPLLPRKTAETEDFDKGDVEVHQAQSGDGAAHVRVVPIRLPGGFERGEIGGV